MKKKIFIWLFVFCTGMPGVQDWHSAYASEGNEAYAVDLVNQIRKDPLTYAEALGYDRNVLLVDLPWINWIKRTGADEGLGEVASSDVLARRAENENMADITDNPDVTIIAEDSDGDAGEDAVTMNTDYAAEGNTSGIVAFYTFMKPSAAIKLVIDNQFKKEIDPNNPCKRILLSPEYKLIGLSFRSGSVQMESGPVNAYLIYITLSSSLLKSEVQVVNMINQVRDNPARANIYLPYTDLSFLADNYGGPLFFNDALEATARAVLSDNKVDVPAHARNAGFSGTAAGYPVATPNEIFPDADTLVRGIFSSLLNIEAAAYPERSTIFHPQWNEAGAALYKEPGNGTSSSVKLAMVTGQSDASANELFRIYGVAYADKDANGVYTPGEEAVEKPVTAYDNTRMALQTVLTNKAGQFSFRLPGNAGAGSGYYIEIEATQNEGGTGCQVDLDNDRFLLLKVQQ